MKVVFFDLETTGTLVNKHGIHQISGMIVIDGEVKETFDFKVQPNPKAEIVQEALDVAGVTKEQILSYPAMGYVYGQFTAILNKYVDKYNKQDKFFLAGYNNASFDNQFLRAWFLQNGTKEIVNGESYIQLSSEEKEALEQAKTVEEEIQDLTKEAEFEDADGNLNFDA